MLVKKSFLVFLVALMMAGCARLEYAPVYIPTKCKIKKREKPQQTKDITKDIKEILIYTEQIEKDLNFCIDGVNND